MTFGTTYVSYKVMYRDMQKKAREFKITTCVTHLSVSCITMNSASFNQPGMFQPGTPMSFQSAEHKSFYIY